MKKEIMAGTLLIFLSVGFQSGPRDGKELDIELTDGTTVSAEILSIRDSSMVVAHPAGLTEEELRTTFRAVAVLPFSRIQQVRTAGRSYTVMGLFAGMTIGCIGGCAIGSAQEVTQDKTNDPWGCKAEEERQENTLTGAAIGAAGGALVGAVVGSAVSGTGRELIAPGERNFSDLKYRARYPSQEPEFLRAIAR